MLALVLGQIKSAEVLLKHKDHLGLVNRVRIVASSAHAADMLCCLVERRITADTSGAALRCVYGQ